MRVVLITMMLMAGCGGPPGSACTLLGCEDTLTINAALGDPAAVPFEFRMTIDGQEVDFSCSHFGGSAPPCGRAPVEITHFNQEGHDVWALVIKGSPKSVAAKVTSSAGTVLDQSWSNIGYEPLYPNGKDCPPVCQVAHIY